MNEPKEIYTRTFKHTFKGGHVAVTAIVDLRPSQLSGEVKRLRCVWSGIKDGEPWADYEEFIEWIHSIYTFIANETSEPQTFMSDGPGVFEVWFYAPGHPPRKLESWKNPGVVYPMPGRRYDRS